MVDAHVSKYVYAAGGEGGSITCANITVHVGPIQFKTEYLPPTPQPNPATDRGNR